MWWSWVREGGRVFGLSKIVLYVRRRLSIEGSGWFSINEGDLRGLGSK